MKIRGIEFDVDYEVDRDGRIESMAVFLEGHKEDLIDVLSEDVLKEIEEYCYNHPDLPDYDYKEDR